MAKVTMIDIDVWGVLERRYRPTILTARAMPYKVVLEIDADSEDLFKKDPLLRQECMDAATEVYQDFLEKLTASLERAEDNCRRTNTASARKRNSKKLSDDYKKLAAAAQSKSGEDMAAAIERLKQLKKDEGWDSFSFAYKVVTKGASFTYSLFGLLSAPFTGGISAVVAVVNLIGQGVELYKEYQTHVASIGQINSEIEKALKDLKQSFKRSKGWQTLADLGKTAWNDLASDKWELVAEQIGVPSLKGLQLWFVEAGGTIKECEDQIKVMRQKLRKMDSLSHGSAEKLQTALDQLDDMSGKIDQRHPCARDVDKLQGKVQELIGKVIAAQTRTKKFTPFIARFESDLSTLKGTPHDLYDYVMGKYKMVDLVSKADELVDNIAENGAKLDEIASFAKEVIDEVVDNFDE